MIRRERLIWLTIFLAACIAIIPSVLRSDRACEPDSDRYLSLAARLARSGCFCNSNGSPHATTPPLYPALAMAALVGADPSLVKTAGSVEYIDRAPVGFRCRSTTSSGRLLLFGVQALLIVWSAYCLARLAESFGLSQSLARASALVYGLSPLPLVYAGRILSETLFVALLMSGIWLLQRPVRAVTTPPETSPPTAAPARLRRVGPRLEAILSGVMFGAATLTRALLIPWILLLPVFAALLPSWRRRLILAFAGAMILIVPWSLRNLIDFGSPGLSAATGTNAFAYAAALAADDDRRDIVLDEVRGPRPLANPFAESDARVRAAARIIAARPLAFLIGAVRTFPALLAPPAPEIIVSLAGSRSDSGTLARMRERGPSSAFETFLSRLRQSSGPTAIATVILSLIDIVITAAGLAGLFVVLAGGRRTQTARRTASIVLLGSLAFVLVATSIGAWHPRFRAPFSPALAVLACVFAARLPGWLRSRKRATLPASE